MVKAKVPTGQTLLCPEMEKPVLCPFSKISILFPKTLQPSQMLSLGEEPGEPGDRHPKPAQTLKTGVLWGASNVGTSSDEPADEKGLSDFLSFLLL